MACQGTADGNVLGQLWCCAKARARSDLAKPSEILSIDLGKFHHDLTTTEPWESYGIIGESLVMVPFDGLNLVNYSNLPR